MADDPVRTRLIATIAGLAALARRMLVAVAMRHLAQGILVAVFSLQGCHAQGGGETPMGRGVPNCAPEGPPRVYIEAVMLQTSRSQMQSLPAATVSELASRTDGTVVSAPHVIIEAGRPTTTVLLPGDANGTTEFLWRFDAAVLDGDRVKLALGITGTGQDVVAETTLVIEDGQTAVLPTLLRGPEGEVVVVVLGPEVVRDNQDLQRILAGKQAGVDGGRHTLAGPPAPKASH